MISLVFIILCWPKTLNDIHIEYNKDVYNLEIVNINSEGWEDSPEISYYKTDPLIPDSYLLTFCFTQYDFGSLSIGKIRIMPSRKFYGDSAADCMWGHPKSTIAFNFPDSVNKKKSWDGCLNTPTYNLLKEVYFSRSFDNKRGLYRALARNNWLCELLPNTVNLNGFSVENTADNPFKTKSSLYFEQKDGDNTNFYKVDNLFKNKRPLPFNTKENETQLWCDPSESLFMFCRNHYEIWSYSNKIEKKIIYSKLKCSHEELLDKSIPFYKKFDAVAEPSMNENGDIYFLYVFNKDDMFDADILVLKRKGI